MTYQITRAQRQALDDPHNLDRLHELLTMLHTCRPMGSATEHKFRADYLHDLPGMITDPYGNLHTAIARQDGSTSRVLWSCHTDTVHWDEGDQRVTVTGRYLQLSPSEQYSNCLGADDTVGVWIMRQMILAGIPGHYVFHHGEEHGGIGSGDVTRYEPERFADALYAIAFDRRGTRDIITRQAGGRCASDTFAYTLARQLRPVAKYRPSPNGVYTDTAEYMHLVPECTNISVGYEAEHGDRERVDYWHAIALLTAMLRFDESQLIAVRDLNQAKREREDRLNRRRLLLAWRQASAEVKAYRDRPGPKQEYWIDDAGKLIEVEEVDEISEVDMSDDWRRAASWPKAYGQPWRVKTTIK